MASGNRPPHYVYVIGWDAGWQKVGFSYRPEKRAEVLRKAGAPRYKVHHQVEVAPQDVRGVEALAHHLLRAHHEEGEWFGVTPAEAIAAVDDAVVRYAAGERCPPRPDLMSVRRQIVCTKSWVREVEEWCKRQPGRAPSFGEAVRTLVERALDARGFPRP